MRKRGAFYNSKPYIFIGDKVYVGETNEYHIDLAQRTGHVLDDWLTNETYNGRVWEKNGKFDHLSFNDTNLTDTTKKRIESALRHFYGETEAPLGRTFSGAVSTGTAPVSGVALRADHYKDEKEGLRECEYLMDKPYIVVAEVPDVDFEWCTGNETTNLPNCVGMISARGGINSHFALVAREQDKPYIIAPGAMKINQDDRIDMYSFADDKPGFPAGTIDVNGGGSAQVVKDIGHPTHSFAYSDGSYIANSDLDHEAKKDYLRQFGVWDHDLGTTGVLHKGGYVHHHNDRLPEDDEFHKWVKNDFGKGEVHTVSTDEPIYEKKVAAENLRFIYNKHTKELLTRKVNLKNPADTTTLHQNIEDEYVEKYPERYSFMTMDAFTNRAADWVYGVGYTNDTAEVYTGQDKTKINDLNTKIRNLGYTKIVYGGSYGGIGKDSSDKDVHKCPNCGSHTSKLIDIDNKLFKCHTCGNEYKDKNLVKVESKRNFGIPEEHFDFFLAGVWESCHNCGSDSIQDFNGLCAHCGYDNNVDDGPRDPSLEVPGDGWDDWPSMTMSAKNKGQQLLLDLFGIEDDLDKTALRHVELKEDEYDGVTKLDAFDCPICGSESHKRSSNQRECTKGHIFADHSDEHVVKRGVSELYGDSDIHDERKCPNCGGSVTPNNDIAGVEAECSKCGRVYDNETYNRLPQYGQSMSDIWDDTLESRGQNPSYYGKVAADYLTGDPGDEQQPAFSVGDRVQITHEPDWTHLDGEEGVVTKIHGDGSYWIGIKLDNPVAGGLGDDPNDEYETNVHPNELKKIGAVDYEGVCPQCGHHLTQSDPFSDDGSVPQDYLWCENCGWEGEGKPFQPVTDEQYRDFLVGKGAASTTFADPEDDGLEQAFALPSANRCPQCGTPMVEDDEGIVDWECPDCGHVKKDQDVGDWENEGGSYTAAAKKLCPVCNTELHEITDPTSAGDRTAFECPNYDYYQDQHGAWIKDHEDSDWYPYRKEGAAPIKEWTDPSNATPFEQLVANSPVGRTRYGYVITPDNPKGYMYGHQGDHLPNMNAFLHDLGGDWSALFNAPQAWGVVSWNVPQKSANISCHSDVGKIDAKAKAPMKRYVAKVTGIPVKNITVGTNTTTNVVDYGTSTCHNITLDEKNKPKLYLTPEQSHRGDLKTGKIAKVADTNGHELMAGRTYVMHSTKYKVPDVVMLTSVEPDKLEAVIAGDNKGYFPITITREDYDKFKYSFEPKTAGTDPKYVDKIDNPNMPYRWAYHPSVGLSVWPSHTGWHDDWAAQHGFNNPAEYAGGQIGENMPGEVTEYHAAFSNPDLAEEGKQKVTEWLQQHKTAAVEDIACPTCGHPNLLSDDVGLLMCPECKWDEEDDDGVENHPSFTQLDHDTFPGTTRASDVDSEMQDMSGGIYQTGHLSWAPDFKIADLEDTNAIVECPKCGYELEVVDTNTPSICPDCKWPLDEQDIEPKKGAKDDTRMTCPECGSHNIIPSDQAWETSIWQCMNCGKEDYAELFDKTSAVKKKTLSAQEQLELINEEGEARNLHKLNLEGTHYDPIEERDELTAHFNWFD